MSGMVGQHHRNLQRLPRRDSFGTITTPVMRLAMTYEGVSNLFLVFMVLMVRLPRRDSFGTITTTVMRLAMTYESVSNLFLAFIILLGRLPRRKYRFRSPRNHGLRLAMTYRRAMDEYWGKIALLLNLTKGKVSQ